MSNAIDSDRGFGDVRCDNDFAEWVGREGQILLFGRDVTVQRNQSEPLVVALNSV